MTARFGRLQLLSIMVYMMSSSQWQVQLQQNNEMIDLMLHTAGRNDCSTLEKNFDQASSPIYASSTAHGNS